MKLKALLLTSLLAASALQGAILAGDIMIVGFRSDADDAISFVTWTTINAGEELFFTDSGFFASGTLRDSENIMSWIAPIGGIIAGTVVRIDSPLASSATVGTTTGALSGLANGGDQVFIGSSAFPATGDTSDPGSTYSGTLIYGFDYNGTAGWDATATSAGTSHLPTALNSLGLNMGVAHFDNGQYTDPKTGLTIAQYKTEILNSSNWTLNDDGAAFGVLNTTDFTIVPEPSAALLGAIGFIALLRRRRR
jgi:hypothetical protein